MHILIILTVLLVIAIILLSRKKKHPPIPTIGSKYEKEISEREFESLVIEQSKTTPVLADFYAKWCPPCQLLTPMLAELAEEYSGSFLLAKIDMDENPKLKNHFGISAYPTVALFKGGEPVASFTGGRLEHTIRYKLAEHGIQATRDAR
ncbi:MAG: thioredoxin domain-containing protein [Pseudomonadota bacterium]